MIEIVMTGMCEGCKYAELVLDVYRADSDENYWSVRCTHENACNRTEDKTIDRLKKRQEDE